MKRLVSTTKYSSGSRLKCKIWRFLSSSVSSSNESSSRSSAEDYTAFGFTEIPRSEKDSRVKSVFSSVAESYDVMNDLMSLGVHRYWKDEFVKLSQLDLISKTIRSNSSNDNTEPFQVLDVAGGTGDISFRFVDTAGCFERSRSSGEDLIQITVCDINSNMLQVGKQRAREKYGDALLSQTKALTFVEGNAENLPFKDNCFDLYTIAFGLRNVTNTGKALQEAYRVLKPGGRFLCLEFSNVQNCALSSLYDFYSFNIIPAIGELVAKDRKSYQYLVESIRTFYNQEELKEKLQNASFQGVHYTNMTHGIVAIHEGWKIY